MHSPTTSKTSPKVSSVAAGRSCRQDTQGRRPGRKSTAEKAPHLVNLVAESADALPKVLCWQLPAVANLTSLEIVARQPRPATEARPPAPLVHLLLLKTPRPPSGIATLGGRRMARCRPETAPSSPRKQRAGVRERQVRFASTLTSSLHHRPCVKLSLTWGYSATTS